MLVSYHPMVGKQIFPTLKRWIFPSLWHCLLGFHTKLLFTRILLYDKPPTARISSHQIWGWVSILLTQKINKLDGKSKLDGRSWCYWFVKLAAKWSHSLPLCREFSGEPKIQLIIGWVYTVCLSLYYIHNYTHIKRCKCDYMILNTTIFDPDIDT